MKLPTTLCSLVTALMLSAGPLKADEIKIEKTAKLSPPSSLAIPVHFPDISFQNNNHPQTDNKPEFFFQEAEMVTGKSGNTGTNSKTSTASEILLLFDSLSPTVPYEPFARLLPKTESTLHKLTLIKTRLSNPNPLHQDSGGIVHVRFELPAGISYNHFNKTFEMPPWSFRPKGEWFMYEGNPIRGYFFPSDYFSDHSWDFLEKIQIGDFSAREMFQMAKSQLPSLAEKQRIILSDLWRGITTILEARKIETALTFGDFFRDILPPYTSDGVVTPDELVLIQDATRRKVEEYYNTSLTPKEKKQIDGSLEEFIYLFNANNNSYHFTRNILSIFSGESDPLSRISFTPNINARKLYEMFVSLKPLYTLTVNKNSFEVESNFYSRFRASGDEFHTFFFQDHIFRRGSLSLSKGAGEAHLNVNGEVHGGRPLRDFLDQKYATDFDTIELLLGYRPVFIDGTLNADVNGFVHFENFLLNGYEEIFPFNDRIVGVGFVEGYAYYFDADGKINVNASSDSFSYSARTDVKGHLSLKESRGTHGRIYLFSWKESDSLWQYLSLGITSEHLNVRTKNWAGDLKFKADFSGKYSFDYSWEDNVNFQRESNYVPQFSLRSGFSLGAGNPFFYFNNNGPGVGIATIHPLFTFLAETQFPSYAFCDILLAPAGKIDAAAAKSYHRKTQQLADSFFPAKHALLTNEQHLYFSHLTGTFLEWSWMHKDEQGFPYDPSTIFKIGVLTGKKGTAYSRFGYLGDFTTQKKGIYLSFGSPFVETQFSLLEEDIPERQSSSASINLSSRFNIEDVTITAWAQLYAPALGRYAINRENVGDITYNLAIEGYLEQIPIALHKGFVFFKELGSDFLRANWYIDYPNNSKEKHQK